MLELAGDAGALERADHGVQQLVLPGVQAVQDGAGQGVLGVQRVQQGVQRAGAVDVVHAVKAGVRPQPGEHGAVGVSHAVVVDLHHPAHGVVALGAEQQQRRLEALGLFHRDALAPQGLFQDGVHLLPACASEGHVVQAVVGGPAARLVKGLHPLLQRPLQAVQIRDLHPGAAAQLGQEVRPARLFQVQRLVRPEGGGHHRGDGRILRDALVPRQIGRGVVGGAHHGHVALAEDAPDAHIRLCQLFDAQIPDPLGGVAVEHALIAEVGAQLQVAPVVHGVADGPGQRLGKLLELLPLRGVPGDVPLVHPVGAHHPPLVVIPLQPDLVDVLKPAVLKDLPGIHMAVVVDDGHFLCVVVVEPLGGGGGQQKVLIHKRSHARPSRHTPE